MRWSGTGSNSWTNEPTDRTAGASSQIDARGSSGAPLFVHLLLHPLYSLLTFFILPALRALLYNRILRYAFFFLFYFFFVSTRLFTRTHLRFLFLSLFILFEVSLFFSFFYRSSGTRSAYLPIA